MDEHQNSESEGIISDIWASIFGGGAQTAPVMPTLNVGDIGSQFLSQDFGAIQNLSSQLTKNTSASNLGAYLGGLNTVNPGALSGINSEQNLGNSLFSGNTGDLPLWARNYLNNGTQQGAESAIGRGVGAFSDNSRTGTNQYQGNNAMELLKLGQSFMSDATNKSGGIVGSTLYKSDPTSFMMSPSQFLQAGEFNTGIDGQNAVAAAAAANFNENNSPLGNGIRTGLSMISSLLGSYLGDSQLGSAFATTGNGATGPIGGSMSTGGGGGGSMGGMGAMGMML